MKLFQTRILIVSAISVMTLCACNSSDKPKAGVAATVNGTAISESRVDMLVKQGAAQGQPDNPEIRKAIIDQLSMQFLISQAAIKKGIDKKPQVLDQLDLTRQSILANAFVEDYLKNNPISDDILKVEYAKVTAQMTGNEYKARHILVDKEAEAKDIIVKLRRNPKAFESLAKAQSKDTGSKTSGGDLGWFDPHGMVPEFGKAVAKLTKGQFTEEPVKSQFGYHVILLEDSRPRTIPPLDQVKSQLQQQVQQQSLKKLFDDMRAKAKIELAQAAAPAMSIQKESNPADNNKPAEPGK